jgi:hypothetical protein
MYDLKTLRLLLFCSQSELGAILGRSSVTIGHVESGRRTMPIGNNAHYYELQELFLKWQAANYKGDYTPDELHRQWLQEEELRVEAQMKFRYESHRALWSQAIQELDAMMKRYWLAFDGAEFSSFLMKSVKSSDDLFGHWFITSKSRAREAMQRDGPLAQKYLMLKIEGLETQLNKAAKWLGKDGSDLEFMRSVYTKLITEGVKAGIFNDHERI